METFFGFDEESVDSETLSETSCNTDRTDRAPATPEEDLDDVSGPHPRVLVKGCPPPHPASVAAGQTSQDPKGGGSPLSWVLRVVIGGGRRQPGGDPFPSQHGFHTGDL